MTRLQWSFVIWGPWLMYFTLFELWSVFKGTRSRWLTLSSTVDDVEHWWWPIQFIIIVGLAILMIHWAAGGPVKLALVKTKKMAKTIKVIYDEDKG